MMDSYAASHKGLAPIVVMPDNIGSNFANPLCADTKYGNAETYLSVDVPAWIKASLQAAEGPAHWAIAGLSNGGTCSLQMATRHPELYGRFIDISGEYEPLDDSREETVGKYFNGDNEAYSRISPVEIMKQRRFEQTAGRIVVGKGDRTYNGQLRRVLEACTAAGMDMSFLELPGGHTWQVWAPGLRDSLGWLAAKTGLVRE
jgi:S-formylglutathione hydrolase FrmB